AGSCANHFHPCGDLKPNARPSHRPHPNIRLSLFQPSHAKWNSPCITGMSADIGKSRQEVPMKRFILIVAVLVAPVLASLSGCSLAVDHDHDSAYNYNTYPQYYGYAPRYHQERVYYVEPRPYHDDHIVVHGY